jgi:hypothetical protein
MLSGDSFMVWSPFLTFSCMWSRALMPKPKVDSNEPAPFCEMMWSKLHIPLYRSAQLRS